MTALLLPVTVATLGVATKMVASFIGLLFVAALVLPGLERPGHALPNGDAKDYKLYGMALFFLLHIVLGIAFFGFRISLTPIVQYFWSLLIVANIGAVVWALALYVYGKRAGNVLKSEIGHNLARPSWVKDLWFGNEFNPTWLGVDLKMFMYQPSLLGAYLIVLAFADAQYERHGVVTPQMWCFVGFWFGAIWSMCPFFTRCRGFGLWTRQTHSRHSSGWHWRRSSWSS